ncbi:MAG: MBL fold metallo-hydrolase, partial [Dolichospermum sp.]
MQIIRLPVLSDNYIFLLHDPQQNIAAVVDPAEAQPVLDELTKLKTNLVAIFNTHHHGDHVGGNTQLMKKFPQVTVYGGAEDRGRIPGQQVFLQEGDRVQFGNRTANVLFVPGHTRAHIAYY